jgi:hypothetical protein
MTANSTVRMRSRTARRLAFLWTNYERLRSLLERGGPETDEERYGLSLERMALRSMGLVTKPTPAEPWKERAYLASEAQALRRMGLVIYRRHVIEVPMDKFEPLEEIERALEDIQTKFGDPAPWSEEEFDMLKEGQAATAELFPMLNAWTQHLTRVVRAVH